MKNDEVYTKDVDPAIRATICGDTFIETVVRSTFETRVCIDEETVFVARSDRLEDALQMHESAVMWWIDVHKEYEEEDGEDED